MRRISVGIEGMTCGGCVVAAQNALAKVPGVRAAIVALDAGRAEVHADDGVDPALLTRALENAGYTARVLA